MSIRGRKNRQMEEPNVDMVPIMNMFLVLIPFMLLSTSFFTVKAINTSVPVISNRADASPGDKDFKKETKVMVTVEIKEDSLSLYGISQDADPKEIAAMDRTISKTEAGYPFDQMVVLLQEIKRKYPASDTLLVIPEQKILYDTIIQTMDAARYVQQDVLFPKVVLSGKL